MRLNFSQLFSWLLRTRRARFTVLCIVLCWILYNAYLMTLPIRYAFSNLSTHKQCIIPDVDPFDKSIMKYVWDTDPIICDSRPDLFYFDQNEILQQNETTKKILNVKKLDCSYKMIARNNDDRHVIVGEEVQFKPPVYINSDFVVIVCRNEKRQLIYEKLMAHINKKRTLQVKSVLDSSKEQYSVYIFGLDSVSRLAAERKLPKTMQYLRQNLDAYVFNGFMKIGDNTQPNLISAFTGEKADSPELSYIRGRLDNYPFIWKNFSAAGYATLLAEDAPDMTMFNILSGFEHEPTDHYFRPFWLSTWNVSPLQYIFDPFMMLFEDQKVGLKKTSSFCYGNLAKHVLQVNYYKQFIEAYRGKRRFGLSWISELCHNFQNFCGNGDHDFLSFFRWMHESDHLENAILIFMSDHGSRIDAIRNTFVGRIEERMPIFSLHIPKNLHKQFPHLHQILLENTNRLTTHYDLHETLKDILNSNFELRKNTKNLSRGISLFSPIPETRTCAQAWVPEHFCACYDSTPANITSPVIKTIAKYILEHLNKVLSPVHDKCAKLSLAGVKDARKVTLGLKHVSKQDPFSFFGLLGQDDGPEKVAENRYLVLIEANPSKGLFEATVTYESDSKMVLHNDVSRTNRYGNQSACVDNRLYRQYCFCV